MKSFWASNVERRMAINVHRYRHKGANMTFQVERDEVKHIASHEQLIEYISPARMAGSAPPSRHPLL